jgi:hypothetical protein
MKKPFIAGYNGEEGGQPLLCHFDPRPIGRDKLREKFIIFKLLQKQDSSATASE